MATIVAKQELWIEILSHHGPLTSVASSSSATRTADESSTSMEPLLARDIARQSAGKTKPGIPPREASGEPRNSQPAASS